MKLEFYAFVFLIISVIALSMLVLSKKPTIQEEVLPSPSLFIRNPYKYLLLKRTNEINQQLFFLEYNKRILVKDDSKELEKEVMETYDRRAAKYVIKRVWKYWWGYGIEWSKYKIKHIELTWYPKVYVVKHSENTFGEALWNALNGKNIPFSFGRADEELVKLIAEKYNVELVIKNLSK
ncbi:hypothetical protein [Fervidobacterium sp.]